MVERVTQLLECDVCHVSRQSRVGESIASLRDRLAEVGWRSDHAYDTDLCPTHVDQAVDL